MKHAILTGLCSIISLTLFGCVTLPENPDKPASFSQSPAVKGVLVEHSRAVLAGADAGDSAFMLIRNNEQALRWRLALIDSAEQSIDLQVFIWSNDQSGRLLLDRIMAAADRGVKVRLLVDDMPKDWTDRGTALVARLPNVELRRFNPGNIRTGTISRTLQFAAQFEVLNRRMHNKQLIVDGQWGIIGSRNIGNPYFGLSEKYNNRDLDVLITGPVIQQMSADFDEYWNSDTAYPGQAMAKTFSKRKAQQIFVEFDTVVIQDRQLLKQTNIPVEITDWHDQFAKLPERMVTGQARIYQDTPIVEGDRGIRLADQIENLDLDIQHQSLIITPYMIPSKEQLKSLSKAINEENRKIRILVPSMESNNHTIVHSHYKKYRKRLLKIGVELFELRGQPSDQLRSDSDTPPIQSEFISLHTKAFVMDKRWVLLGSLNVDPRSIEINTENLLLIDCPPLAQEMVGDFETMCAPENAWAVTLNDKGQLQWNSTASQRTIEPARDFCQRLSDFFYQFLPIESQL